MTDPRLVILQSTAPAWIEVETVSPHELLAKARPPETAWATSGVRLRFQAQTRIAVGEVDPGTVFPARCPERHIQGDRTFCLGLTPVQPTAAELAGPFWEQLRQYLVCQHVADQTRVWPPNHALSHGDAGEHHERALELAAELGCVEDYDRARLGESSWITDRRVRVISNMGSPLNSRGPCPRGCRNGRRRQRQVLWGACPRQAGVAELIFREQERRRELEVYWAEVSRSGATCCGRMQGCRLLAPSAASEAA